MKITTKIKKWFENIFFSGTVNGEKVLTIARVEISIGNKKKKNK